MNTTTEILWEKFCREAAERAGITIEELKKRLASGEYTLQINAVIDPTQTTELPND